MGHNMDYCRIYLSGYIDKLMERNICTEQELCPPEQAENW